MTARTSLCSPRLVFKRAAAAARRQLAVPRAQGEQGPSPPPLDEEARLEAFEASVRAKKGSRAAQEEAQRARSARPEPFDEGVPWKEGSLFPEGWDQMDPLEKATQVYMGKYGALYWANKAAWFSIIGLGFAWVLFRVVLPLTGAYQLADDLGTPGF
jgi:hypothetical protein